jgi:hypothetical protein
MIGPSKLFQTLKAPSFHMSQLWTAFNPTQRLDDEYYNKFGDRKPALYIKSIPGPNLSLEVCSLPD